MKNTALSIAIRGVLSASTIPLLCIDTALAQDNDDIIVEEIEVTGSRISRPSLTSPTPLQVLNSEDIGLAAEVNIGEFLNQLPSVGTPTFNRTNSNFDISNSGVVNVDLRDLGPARTLTLVNGRRFVAGVPGSSAVDLNSIPTAMIKRAELITGGSSAVYGSDAIAGVVNFILKDDFEGVELTSRYEITGEDDGEEYDVGLLVGSNFDEGKGNAVIYFGYTDQGAVFSRDRERSKTDAVSSAALGTGGIFEQTIPFFSSFPPQGRFDAGNAANYTYAPDGTLINNFSSAANGFNRSAFRTIAIPTERFLTATNIHYNLSEDLTLFFEGTYSGTNTVAQLEPFPLDSSDIFLDNNSGGIPLQYKNSAGVDISNPFVPTAILNDIATNNLNPDLETKIDGIRFRRRLAEFGPRGATNERKTIRFSTGLEGDLYDWEWDASYTSGQTTQAQRSAGNVDITAFRFALLSEADPDKPGSFRCVERFARETGCVPINVFGAGSISQEAINYISAGQTRNAKIEQDIFQANIKGSPFELPAGSLKIAAGYERRVEKSEAVNDALTVRGLNSSNASPNVSGQFDVSEFYLETSIPILSDTFVDYFGINFAGRASDYSTVGSVSTLDTKMELKLNGNIAFRASQSTAVRAPNIDELFDPGTQTFAQVNDPCAGVTASTAGVVADNCRSIPAIAKRIEDTGAFTLTQSELQGTTGFIGGNENLFEETAETFTVGVVHTPTYLPEALGLTVSLDYWDIEVEDAIFAVSQNNVAKLCYEDSNFPNNPLCNNIVRFPISSTERGALDEVNSGSANVGQISTSGYDLDLNINLDLHAMINLPGSLSINTVYTYLDEYEVINLPGTPADNEAGEIGNAKRRFNTNFRYRLDDLMVQLQMRYIHDSRIEDTDFTDADCADTTVVPDLKCKTDSVIYSDLQVRYTLPAFSSSEVQIFGGIENVFDEEPPILSAGLTDSDTGTETAAGVYDAIGRAYYVGLKVKF